MQERVAKYFWNGQGFRASDRPLFNKYCRK